MPYKVVSAEQPDIWTRKLVSAYAWGKFECQYSTTEWTTAPVGGLLCFETYDDARLFYVAEQREDLEIWECLGEEPVTLGVWSITNPSWGWAQDPSYLELQRDCWWPDGTVAYKRVKLLTKIPTPVLAVAC